MTALSKNFAYSTVATAPSPATSGTSLVVTAADGAKFPPTPFWVTIWPVSVAPLTTNAEIAQVTTVATDTFTIVRAQQGSSARSVVVGDQIAATETAPLMGATSSLAFTVSDTLRRLTITDANASANSNIVLSLMRPNVTDADDPGWIYIANVVNRAAGSFDILVAALDWGDGIETGEGQMPNETVTLVYQVLN